MPSRIPDLHQVRQTAAEAIQPPHHKGVTCPERLPALLQLWPGCILAAGRFLVDGRAPGLPERVPLQV